MAPNSILIIGSGVFGLSTAHALARSATHAHTKITVLDRSPFPSPDGSSIDSSRVIRADYSDPAYARLAARAQREWRKQGRDDLGGEGRYRESGLVVTYNAGAPGEAYVRRGFENVSGIAREAGDGGAIVGLGSEEEIVEAVGSGGGSGSGGYLNKRSGWADAEGGMRWLRRQVEATGRVDFVHAEVEELVREGKQVMGVRLKDHSTVYADLVVLATGAWTGKLVDLRGRATATGQVLLYLDLTAGEQEKLGKMPIMLNMSTGLFIIPPAKQVLKVARHAYGYSNPTSIIDPNGSGEMIEVSLPRTAVDEPNQWVPREGEDDCRRALREIIPSLGERPFKKGRVCWYMDTPKGDFLITYHPDFTGLFLATGGSGHGFKFLPTIGDKIVDCISGKCPEEFKEKWAWPKETVDVVITNDGSRGGVPGLVFDTEIRRE